MFVERMMWILQFLVFVITLRITLSGFGYSISQSMPYLLTCWIRFFSKLQHLDTWTKKILDAHFIMHHRYWLKLMKLLGLLE